MRRTLIGLLGCVAAGAAFAEDASVPRCRQIADPAQRLVCYDAIPLPSGAAAAAAEAAPRREAERFGFERKSPESTPVDSVESSIAGRFDGWRPRQEIRLDNGQIWQIADDSTAYLRADNPKVTVRRGLLGAYYLDIEGTNRSPRVKRTE